MYQQAKICGYNDAQAHDFANDYINNCIQDFCSSQRNSSDNKMKSLADVMAENKQLLIHLHAHSFAEPRQISTNDLVNSINNILNHSEDWKNDNAILLQIIRTQKRLFAIKNEIILFLRDEIKRVKDEKNMLTSISKTTAKISSLDIQCDVLDQATSISDVEKIINNMLQDKTLTQSRGLLGSLSLYNSTLQDKLILFSEKLAKLAKIANVHPQTSHRRSLNRDNK